MTAYATSTWTVRLPLQGEPQPWWYGIRWLWDGDDLVVETNNLRGADEDSPDDGWMDVDAAQTRAKRSSRSVSAG